jgi:hypothetical protein
LYIYVYLHITCSPVPGTTRNPLSRCVGPHNPLQNRALTDNQEMVQVGMFTPDSPVAYCLLVNDANAHSYR